jgi:hypothetical protein
MDATSDCRAYASDLKTNRRSAAPCDANDQLLRVDGQWKAESLPPCSVGRAQRTRRQRF